MIEVPDVVRELMLQNEIVPAELLMIRLPTQTRDAAFFRRTNAPFDITYPLAPVDERIDYQSGLYPLVKLASPDNSTMSERSILQLQLQDVNWALRDEFLANGASRLLCEFRLALLGPDYQVVHVLRHYEMHSVSALSDIRDGGPVASVSFAGPLDKLSAERAVVISEDSERQRDPVGDSMKYAHEARNFRWAY